LAGLWCLFIFFFFFSSRRRHTRSYGDWSSDVCSSDLNRTGMGRGYRRRQPRPIPVRFALHNGHTDEWSAPIRPRAPSAASSWRRSEERRVGKECRSRRAPEHVKKKTKKQIECLVHKET